MFIGAKFPSAKVAPCGTHTSLGHPAYSTEWFILFNSGVFVQQGYRRRIRWIIFIGYLCRIVRGSCDISPMSSWHLWRQVPLHCRLLFHCRGEKNLYELIHMCDVRVTAEGKRLMVYLPLDFTNIQYASRIPLSQTSIFEGISVSMRRIHLASLAVLNQSHLLYALKKQFFFKWAVNSNWQILTVHLLPLSNPTLSVMPHELSRQVPTSHRATHCQGQKYFIKSLKQRHLHNQVHGRIVNHKHF